jgi:hypothetical protein
MTTNKTTVARNMDGFRQGDHALVLSCLTDDVVWDIRGMFHGGKIQHLISYLMEVGRPAEGAG